HKGAAVKADEGGNPHGFRLAHHGHQRYVGAPLTSTPSCSLIAAPNSAVVDEPPRSCVGADASAASIAFESAAAASGRPSPCSSRSTVDRSMAVGFATPRPARSGAEPWTGSKIPGPPSDRLADGARPSPPVTAAARSER